jgi:hypothetical protein
MLNTKEAFLLGGRDQFAIAQERRGGIGVESVDAKNNQYGTFLLLY